MIQRIARIEEPPKDQRRWYGGFYLVWFEGIDGPQEMLKAQFEVLKFENEMLQVGISEEMIEKHRDLIIYYIQDEQARDGECE